jgi:elongation factor Ts
MANIDQIKKLRNITGVSLMKCKEALEKTNDNIEEAREILKKQGQDFAQKRLDRKTKEGIIDSYIHAGKKVGVMIELQCESDFVARSDGFQKLAHEICLQIAAVNLQDTPLLEQPWIKDTKRTIKDLINGYIMKFGENVSLKQFIKYEL